MMRVSVLSRFSALMMHCVMAFVMIGAMSVEVRAEEDSLPHDVLTIYTDRDSQAAVKTFHVDIADTLESLQRGLMHQSVLPSDRGMLFIFDKPKQARFWMRNTLIPLDLIFIKANGEIESIVTRYDTHSDVSTMSQGLVRYVLEINAGLSHHYGIGAGHFMRLGKVL